MWTYFGMTDFFVSMGQSARVIQESRGLYRVDFIVNHDEQPSRKACHEEFSGSFAAKNTMQLVSGQFSATFTGK